jgi:hypothetical protein
MSAAPDLAERLAEYLKTRSTHKQMPSVTAVAGVAPPVVPASEWPKDSFRSTLHLNSVPNFDSISAEALL